MLSDLAFQFRKHMVRFKWSRATNIHRSFCTCGWEAEGTAEHVQKETATHNVTEES